MSYQGIVFSLSSYSMFLELWTEGAQAALSREHRFRKMARVPTAVLVREWWCQTANRILNLLSFLRIKVTICILRENLLEYSQCPFVVVVVKNNLYIVYMLKTTYLLIHYPKQSSSIIHHWCFMPFTCNPSFYKQKSFLTSSLSIYSTVTT